MEVSLSLNRSQAYRLLWLLVGFELVLIIAFGLDRLAGSPIWPIERLVDLDGEQSVATWFSTIQLFVISLFLLLKAWQRQSGIDPSRAILLLAAAVFAFLSLDEAASIHESITDALSTISALPRFRDGHGMWIPIYLGIMALGLAVAGRELKCMWDHHRTSLTIILAGAGVFLAGALGLEILAYQLIPDKSSHLYALAAGIEEFLEMAGASLMLYGSVVFNLQRPAEPQAVRDAEPSAIARVA